MDYMVNSGWCLSLELLGGCILHVTFVIWLWVTSKAPTVYTKACPALLPICSGTSKLLRGSIPYKVYGEGAQSVTSDLSQGGRPFKVATGMPLANMLTIKED